MSGIKGIVLLGRLNYVEENFDKDGLKNLLDKLNVGKESPLFQPIIISKDYPENLLTEIDEILLKHFFNNDLQKFYQLGVWHAQHIMSTYFQVYIDEQSPGGFLNQMVRLRPYLVGLGELSVSEIDPHEFYLLINYGQKYPESVRLSELGFIEEGLRLCGAKDVKSKIEEKDDISVEYKLNWK
ncbi:hypothetical protein Calab_1672 [Caldithrix abyssi DSM 13497]|uniref:Myxococcales-restricted protein, TIGR02265 family n=1 Tax=Caldithrix abyssi DSM 13497 TaxID=880073 RepID=H1XRT0_CALAY|nr:hypothetical protein [Caldithrix abyssi]APF17151.1 Myxococcales-restricted protein, TIGR02265 family [Caldithrix abyssi DSM 13497]EHO41290.1 hypothetical protein Calab_1672 [Caldithrix abyssi DSM 13497]